MSCQHSQSAHCPLCAVTIEAAAPARQTFGEGALQPGATVGRYTVLEPVGQGGMGLVFMAHDPHLQRLVAIKVLRATDAGERDLAQARLLREAHAMAQLSHPNVVPVYDSGPLGSGLFIVMELVQGTTALTWAKSSVRSWREVVDLYLQAGQGLVAAHEKGLIHRDFKPSNVLVGTDGRPRVTDFGLARSLVDATPNELTFVPAKHSNALTDVLAEDLPLTEVGVMMGSPGYMAPEQYAGAETSAAIDQFSFCVTLYEALYGERPYVAATVPELQKVTAAGIVPPPPKGSEVPGWLHRILVKGLSPKPDARHPSMAVLLAALRDDPALRHQRIARWAALAVAFVAIAGALAWSKVETSRACRGSDALLQPAWNDEVKARAEAAFLNTRLPFAPGSWVATRHRLEAWAQEWVSARVEACEATRVRREQTERQLVLRLECLDHRLSEFSSFAEALATADGELVAAAPAAAAHLSPLSPCANIKQLEDRRVPAPSQLSLAQALSQQLARTRALVLAGRYGDARAALVPAVEQAAALHLPALESEAHEVLAEVELEARNYTDAYAHAQQALRAAESAGDDLAAAGLATRLVSLAGWRLGNVAEGRAWAQLASGIIARLGGDLRLEARLEEGLGDTEWHAGNRSASLVAFQRSLALLVKANGPANEDTLDMARLRSDLGWEYVAQGRLKEARDELTRSRDTREKLLGPSHPALVESYNELSYLAVEQLDFVEEIRFARLAVELARSVSTHRVVQARLVLAAALLDANELDEAERELAAIRPVIESLDPARPGRANFTRTHALWLIKKGRFDEALVEARTLMVDQEKRLGATHPEVAITADVVAEAALGLRQWPEVIASSERYLAMKQVLAAADTPRRAQVLNRAAVAHLALGQVAEAAPLAERAVKALGANQHSLVDEAKVTLAEVVVRQGGEASRVDELLREVRGQAAIGQNSALLARLERVRALSIAQHGPPAARH